MKNLQQRQTNRLFHDFTYGIDALPGREKIATRKSMHLSVQAANKTGKRCIISRVRSGYMVFA